MNPNHNSARRGIGAIYTITVLTVLLAFTSLAVDYGRVQLARTELQNAADAAARQGAYGLGESPLAAWTAASTIAAENKCLGDPVRLDYNAGDALAGHYDEKNRSFQALSPWDAKVNAVKITARREGDQAIPTLFASVLGKKTFSVRASAIAVRLPNINSRKWIPATSNPWLAGMPTGTTANPVNPHSKLSSFVPDTVGRDPTTAPAPISINDVPIIPGQSLSFDSIDGGADHKPSDIRWGPDGDPTSMANNRYAYGRDNGGWGGTEFGKSDLRAPFNSVIGVFLTDAVPQDRDAPPALDFFSDPKSREFTSLSPKVGQMFFIGDGATADGVRQEFVVPPGATRLFIGITDSYEWANNQGGHTTTITRPAKIVLVEGTSMR